ncbi:hypothetical protein UlMin_012378 [Ulmus minor]
MNFPKFMGHRRHFFRGGGVSGVKLILNPDEEEREYKSLEEEEERNSSGSISTHNLIFNYNIGNQIDGSRGIMSGTMDRFKMVFERKSSLRMCTLVASFVVSFLIIYYLISIKGLNYLINITSL